MTQPTLTSLHSVGSLLFRIRQNCLGGRFEYCEGGQVCECGRRNSLAENENNKTNQNQSEILVMHISVDI